MQVLMVNLAGSKKQAVREAAQAVGAQALEAVPSGMGRSLQQVLQEGEVPVPAGQMPAFQEEMLIMDGMERRTMEAFLDRIRECGASVALKAVVTPYNRGWTLVQLRGELMQEHLRMRGKPV